MYYLISYPFDLETSSWSHYYCFCILCNLTAMIRHSNSLNLFLICINFGPLGPFSTKLNNIVSLVWMKTIVCYYIRLLRWFCCLAPCCFGHKWYYFVYIVALHTLHQTQQNIDIQVVMWYIMRWDELMGDRLDTCTLVL